MIERQGQVELEGNRLLLRMDDGRRLRLVGKLAFDLQPGDDVTVRGSLLPDDMFEVAGYKNRFLT